MRRFFTTENAEGREKPSVKLGCSCGQHSRLDSSFPCFGQELFTTENTEGTEKENQKKENQKKENQKKENQKKENQKRFSLWVPCSPW